MDAVRLSVIIPSYNAAETLGAQLDALADQRLDGGWELLLVDNRSTDGTAALVKQYEQRIPQLRYLTADERQGRSYACNIGAQAARGAALAFCDADDVVAPEWLPRMAQALEQADLVAGGLDCETLNAGVPWRPPIESGTQHPIHGFLPFAPGGNMGVSRQAFNAVGGFRENIPPCEDVEISWRLQLAGYTLRDAPDAVMLIRYRPSVKSMWRQVSAYGLSDAFMYREFAAHGMPRSSWRKALWRYRWLLTHVRDLRAADPQRRSFWVFRAAACWGRIRGSLVYRQIYL